MSLWVNSLTPGSHGGAIKGEWSVKGSGHAGKVKVRDAGITMPADDTFQQEFAATLQELEAAEGQKSELDEAYARIDELRRRLDESEHARGKALARLESRDMEVDRACRRLVDVLSLNPMASANLTLGQLIDEIVRRKA